MYDVIIIGAGISGLTAAIYSSRASLKTLVIEKGIYGGQIVNSPNIENYPGIANISGADLSNNLYNQARNLGTLIVFDDVLDVKKEKSEFIIETKKEKYKSKTVIIATGTKNRTLNIGEEKFIGRGVSYCATCDGALYKDKTVAVVGGGNTALDDVLYLSSICKKIYLIHRRDEFRAQQSIIDKISNIKNVELILNSVVLSVGGEQRVDSIEIKNLVTDEKSSLSVDGLFIAIGQVPQNRIFKGLINIDENGYIVANDDCKTNVEGIFTAGDCRTKNLRQLVTASADGAISATNVSKFLS